MKKLIEAEAAGEEPSAAPAPAEEAGAEVSAAEQEMSEWEKRIEAKAAKGEVPSAKPEPVEKEEPKKKKGIFRKKKK